MHLRFAFILGKCCLSVASWLLRLLCCAFLALGFCGCWFLRSCGSCGLSSFWFSGVGFLWPNVLHPTSHAKEVYKKKNKKRKLKKKKHKKKNKNKKTKTNTDTNKATRHCMCIFPTLLWGSEALSPHSHPALKNCNWMYCNECFIASLTLPFLQRCWETTHAAITFHTI